ncbi:MAG: metallophosphoesterase [Myxococcota bacterium]
MIAAWSACTPPPPASGPDGSPTTASADPVDGGSTPLDGSSPSTTAGTPPTVLDPYVQPAVWVEPQVPVPGGSLTVHYAGPLAHAAALTLHYGWNGWNEQPGFDTELVGYDTVWFADAPMTPTASGYDAVLPVPLDARALHFVVHDPVTDAWDSRDGLDYHASIVFPYVGPWLMPLADGSVDVGFETSVPCLGVVEYGATPALGQLAVGAVFGTVHHVRILATGELWYRVRDSAGTTTEIRRAVIPAPDEDALRIVAVSDLQDNGDDRRWSDVAAEIVAHDPGLILVAGDLAADDLPGLWWTMFDKGRELFATVPVAPAVGNHDTPGSGHDPDTSDFLRYFPLGDAPWSAIDVGPAHLVLLSTETGDDFGADGVQFEFTDADLERADPDRWTIPTFHVPPYDAGTRHGGEQATTRGLTALFDGRADVVVTGHEHLYQRMLPLRYDGQVVDTYGRGAAQGVLYYVLPPGGNWPESEIYPDGAVERDRLAYPPVTPGSDLVPSEIGFVVLELGPDALVAETWQGGTIDAPIPFRVTDRATIER